MRVKFFAIPALDPTDGEAELNRFLASNRVLSIERELTAERQGAFWAVAVTHLDKAGPKVDHGKSKSAKIDYREVLPTADFAVYAELRTLRKELAAEEGVPPYKVFTNAQLAEMVQRRVGSLEQMGEIVGVGPARLKSYGTTFLERLRSLQGGGAEESVAADGECQPEEDAA